MNSNIIEEKIFKTPMTQRALLAISRHHESITPEVLERAEELAIEDIRLESPMVQEKHIEKAIWEAQYPAIEVLEITYAECPHCGELQDVIEYTDEPVTCYACKKSAPIEEWNHAL